MHSAWSFSTTPLTRSSGSWTLGTTGRLAELRLGEIALSVNALSHPGEAAGAAEFDASHATARDIVLIALAGPAASLAGTVLTACVMSAAAPGVLHVARALR